MVITLHVFGIELMVVRIFTPPGKLTSPLKNSGSSRMLEDDSFPFEIWSLFGGTFVGRGNSITSHQLNDLR